MFSDHLSKGMQGKWGLGIFMAVLYFAATAALIWKGLDRCDPTSEIIGMAFMLNLIGIKSAVFVEVGLYVLTPIDWDRS